MTKPKHKPLLPLSAQQTVRAQRKAQALARAITEFEEKCARMKVESARITAITNITAREIMTAQLEALDKDPIHFEGSKRTELLRQLRELDGMD